MRYNTTAKAFLSSAVANASKVGSYNVFYVK